MKEPKRARKGAIKEPHRSFYIELRTHGATSAIKIIRKNMEEVERAIEMYSKNKIVKYLGQVKKGKWIDGENKGKSC